jgi:hypothetical protein
MSAVLQLWASQPEDSDSKTSHSTYAKDKYTDWQIAENRHRPSRLRQEIIDEEYATNLGGIQGMNRETATTEHNSKSTTFLTRPGRGKVPCTWCQVGVGQKIEERSIDWAMGLRPLNKATVGSR